MIAVHKQVLIRRARDRVLIAALCTCLAIIFAMNYYYINKIIDSENKFSALEAKFYEVKAEQKRRSAAIRVYEELAER